MSEASSAAVISYNRCTALAPISRSAHIKYEVVHLRERKNLHLAGAACLLTGWFGKVVPRFFI